MIAFGGHIGGHLEETLSQRSYFGKLLVCEKVYSNLPESVEKAFVVIVGGLGSILPYVVTSAKLTNSLMKLLLQMVERR